jgi:hypothetical protein
MPIVGDPTICRTIANIGMLPPSGVGAIIICIISPNTTPAIKPPTTDARNLSVISHLQRFTAV